MTATRYNTKKTNPTRLTVLLRPKPPLTVQSRVRQQVKEARERRQKILAARMRELNLTMTSISRQTGIDLSYVSRIFSGARMPGLDTTMRLARALSMPLQELADLLIPDLDLLHKASDDDQTATNP